MNAFIVTLASYIWVRGLVVAISGGRSAQDLAPALRWFGIQRLLGLPLIAWIAIVCFVVFTFIMAKTPFGRHLIMIGGNETATFRAGIKVDRNLIIAFVLAGAIAGLAGWLLAIRTSGATANLGVGLLFNAFAAVVIGGVSLKGGVGSLPGVYAGVLLLSSINTAINLMGLPANYTQMIHGLLVLAAVLLDTVKQTSGRSSHDRTARRQGRADHRRGARHRQGHRRSASPRKAPGSCSPTPKSRPGRRPPTSSARPSSRTDISQNGRRRAAVALARRDATAGSTSSSRMPASIPGS